MSRAERRRWCDEFLTTTPGCVNGLWDGSLVLVCSIRHSMNTVISDTAHRILGKPQT